VLIRPVDRKEFEERVFPREYSVIIYTDGNNYYAKNQDGKIICSNSQTVCIQEAVNYLVQFGGGKIFVRRGVYYPNATIQLPDGINITIEGEDASTVFRYTKPFILFRHSPSQPTWTSIVKFRNFKIDRTGSGTNNTDVIAVHYAKYVLFEGLVMEDDFRLASANDAFILSNNNVMVIAKNNYVANKSYGIWVVGYLAIARGNYVRNTAYVGIAANGFTPNWSIPPGFPDYGMGVVEDNVCINCGQGDEAIAVDMGTTRPYPSIGIIRNNKVISDNDTLMRVAITAIGPTKVIIEGNEITGNVGITAITYNFNGDVVVKDNIININGKNVASSTGELIWLKGNVVFKDNKIAINYTDNKNRYRGIELAGNIIMKNNVITIQNPSGYSTNSAVSIDLVNNKPYALIEGNNIGGTIGYSVLMVTSYVSDPHTIIVRDNILSTLLSSGKTLYFMFNNYSPTIYFKYFRNVAIPPMAHVADMYFATSVTPTFIVDWDVPVITWWGSATYKFVNKNSGTATIPANATSITIKHNMSCTPSKVLVTPLAQPSGSIWVSDITSTQFTINISTAPTADLPIAWYAEC